MKKPAQKEIIPIFILGVARSGTTWLCNSFIDCKDCAVLHHDLHHGAHEVDILREHLHWGDISEPDRYLDFLAQYSTLDQFLLAGAEWKHFVENPQPDFYSFFCEMMDEYARKSGKLSWLIKLDSLFYLYPYRLESFIAMLNKRYKRIMTIGIQRDLFKAVRSYLYMEGAHYRARQSEVLLPFILALGIARNVVYYRGIEKLLRYTDGIMIRFEDMLKEPEAVESRIRDYTGLDDYTVETAYRMNTSFVGGESSSGQNLPMPVWSKTVQRVADSSPSAAALILRLFEGHRRGVKKYRRVLKAKYFRDQLIRELEKSNSVRLIEKLKDMD